jgi:hypothetical protein
MERQDAINIAKTEYEKNNAVIDEAYQDEIGFMFTCRKDGLVDPTQAVLFVDDTGARFEAVPPMSKPFFRFLNAKKIST